MTASPRVQFPTLRGRQTQAAIDAGGPIGDRPQRHSRNDDFGHRRRSRQVHGVVLQLLRLQGSDGPRMGPAVPRRGQGAVPRSRRTGPVELGALLQGRRRTLAHVSPPTRRDHQRLAAGDGQRRLRGVLERHLLAADSADHSHGETCSATRLLRRRRPASGCRGAGVDAQSVLLHTAGRGQRRRWWAPSTTRHASPRLPTSSTGRSTTKGAA